MLRLTYKHSRLASKGYLYLVASSSLRKLFELRNRITIKMPSGEGFRSFDSHGEHGRVGSHHDEVHLGAREREVLELLWSLGSARSSKITESLRASLAYSTVMITLDRLFKKGLLLREKRDRAFLYTPALTPDALEHSQASDCASVLRRFAVRR